MNDEEIVKHAFDGSIDMDFEPPQRPYHYMPAENEIVIRGSLDFCKQNLEVVRGMIARGEIPNGNIRNVVYAVLKEGQDPQSPEEKKEKTDAEYRAVLRDPTVPEGVKKSIRQYLNNKNNQKPTLRFPDRPAYFHNGKAVALGSARSYRKPKGMSGRQFKKQKKEYFRAQRNLNIKLS